MNYVGIDIGTTNTAVSWFDPTTDSAVAMELKQRNTDGNMDKHKTIPSAVFFDRDCKPDFGAFASKTMLEHKPDRVFRSWKMLLGTERNFQLDNKVFSPEWVAEALIKKIKMELKDLFQEEIDQALFTLPASASSYMRSALEAAIRNAGFKVDSHLFADEPECAMQNFLLEKRKGRVPPNLLDLSKPKNILVFDIGGGTADVTIHSMYVDSLKRMNSEQLAISRFNRCAGDAFDEDFCNHFLIPQLRKDNPQIRDGQIENLVPALKNLAEKVKQSLCHSYEIRRYHQGKAPKFSEVLHEIQMAHISGSAFSMLRKVSLEDYRKSVEKLISKTSSSGHNIFFPIRDAMNKAKENMGKEVRIDAILFNGGMSYAPFVVKPILEEFPTSKFLNVLDFSNAVSYGASILHYERNIGVKRTSFSTYILPESLFFKRSDGNYCLLAKQGTTLPLKKTNVCAVTVPKVTTEVRFEFYTQGKSTNSPAGTFNTTWNSEIRPGDVLKIDVEISEDKRTKVTVKDSKGQKKILSPCKDPLGSFSSTRPVREPKKPPKKNFPVSQNFDLDAHVRKYRDKLDQASTNGNKQIMNEVKKLEARFLEFPEKSELARGLITLAGFFHGRESWNSKTIRVFHVMGEILGRTLPQDSVSPVMKCLTLYYEKIRKPPLRIVLATALGKIGDKVIETFLQKCFLEAQKSTSIGLIHSLAVSLGKTLETEGSYSKLFEHINSEKLGARSDFLWALARSGSRETRNLDFSVAIQALIPVIRVFRSTQHVSEELNCLYWFAEVLDQRFTFTHGNAPKKLADQVRLEIEAKKGTLKPSNRKKAQAVIDILTGAPSTGVLPVEIFSMRNQH